MVTLRPMWQLRPRIDARTTASGPIHPFGQMIEPSIDGAFRDVRLPADDRVGQDPCARLHHRAFVDEAGP